MFGRKRVYLDSAAASEVSTPALEAFIRGIHLYGNPAAPHDAGKEAEELLSNARRLLANVTGVKPDAVIFTSGATEANALAILGSIRGKARAHVLYVPTQHSSVLGAIEQLKEEGVSTEAIALKDGDIDFVALKSQIRPETVLVTMDVIESETGTRHDTRAVRQLLDEARKGGEKILLHLDATQAPMVENIERTRLAGDLVSLDAQKVGGVRGCGVLLVPSALALSPVIVGGGQERGLRPGTPSPQLASAFAAALEECAKKREAFATKAKEMKEKLIKEIQEKIPHAFINGGKETAPHILNLSFIGRDTDYLAALLNEDGFMVATRSACESESVGSRVVRTLTGDEARALSTLRVSFSRRTSSKDLKNFLKALIKNVEFLDRHPLKKG